MSFRRLTALPLPLLGTLILHGRNTRRHRFSGAPLLSATVQVFRTHLKSLHEHSHRLSLRPLPGGDSPQICTTSVEDAGCCCSSSIACVSFASTGVSTGISAPNRGEPASGSASECDLCCPSSSADSLEGYLVDGRALSSSPVSASAGLEAGGGDELPLPRAVTTQPPTRPVAILKREITMSTAWKRT